MLALAAAAGLAPGASAHYADAETNAHGTVGLSATADGPTTARVESCTFHVRGEGLPMAEGSYHVFRQEGPGQETLFEGRWVGEPDGAGTWSFTVGPFRLEHSMRDLQAVASGIDPATQWHAKASARVDVSCPHDPLYDCPDALVARANDDGTVTLSWTAPQAGATRYAIYHTSPFEPVERVEVTGTTWTHEGTEPGRTYQYLVVAELDEGERRRTDTCGEAEVTAVPFLGAPLLGAVAVAGSVGAYAWLRRR